MSLTEDAAAAMRIAHSGDDETRRRLAAAPDTPPELLFFLSGDSAAPVREAVAGNPGTPAQADQILARDENVAVRQTLARKIGNLCPGLPQGQQERLHRMVWETLSTLVRDTAVQVRAAIAEAVADLPDAPKELILRLARDTAMPVAEPVIRLSPMLTEEDLLALLADPPTPETLCAVARRPCLSETIADAIADKAEPEAVTALLGNPSAAIREATLDALISNSVRHVAWQAPLVRRPHLPPRAARALAEIVAEDLLSALMARPDIDADLAETLRERMGQRQAVARMEAEGPETSFLRSLSQGEPSACAAVLASAAGRPLAAVQRAIAMRSAKAVVSLCWQAGFSRKTAEFAQVALAGLPPGSTLGQVGGAEWPLTPAEMTWQLTLLEAPLRV
ncbi:DUF2336 domain-containing protein [Acetobacteraceae bacterium H6797]|nr:DUF2336 domain-containing protein [Acetobacteraceae bacterium H6797]